MELIAVAMNGPLSVEPEMLRSPPAVAENVPPVASTTLTGDVGWPMAPADESVRAVPLIVPVVSPATTSEPVVPTRAFPPALIWPKTRSPIAARFTSAAAAAERSVPVT